LGTQNQHSVVHKIRQTKKKKKLSREYMYTGEMRNQMRHIWSVPESKVILPSNIHLTGWQTLLTQSMLVPKTCQTVSSANPEYIHTWYTKHLLRPNSH